MSEGEVLVMCWHDSAKWISGEIGDDGRGCTGPTMCCGPAMAIHTP